jgi:hypothetical protein
MDSQEAACSTGLPESVPDYRMVKSKCFFAIGRTLSQLDVFSSMMRLIAHHNDCLIEWRYNFSDPSTVHGVKYSLKFFLESAFCMFLLNNFSLGLNGPHSASLRSASLLGNCFPK